MSSTDIVAQQSTEPNKLMDQAGAQLLDAVKVRADFPILSRSVYGKPLVYLDNAATTQKPRQVIQALTDYYTTCNSNVHRGVHHLSGEATDRYEAARAKVERFINAAHSREIVFVRGATEGINLVTGAFARPRLKAGDQVLITHLEHHSNIVPWQIVCDQTQATLKVAPINDRGELILEDFERLLSQRTKIVAVGHVSNALGTINPVHQIVRMAHRVGATVLIDGAQAVPHLNVDVQALDCDFYVFSGHKLFAPMGIGVLYGKADLLEKMPPYQGGGDMIKSVSFQKTIYNDLPYKFEAGTPNVAGAIGLGAAVDYVRQIGLDRIAAYEHDLLTYATQAVGAIDKLRIIGTAEQKVAVLSFVIEGIHPHDVGTVLDRQGVAVRTGHHCAQPVMDRFNLPATARASLALYNTRQDIDRLVQAIHKVIEVFA